MFKRLKNIESKNEVQLQAIKDQGEKKLKELKNTEANRILPDIKKMDETLDNAELLCTKTDGTKYNFKTFALPLKIVERIYNYKVTLDEAKKNQDKLEKLIIRLEKYNAKKGKRKYERKKKP